MNIKMLGEVRRLVAEGSIQQGSKFTWVCPICCARVTTEADLTVAHRAGMNHCLVHAHALASRTSNRAARQNGSALPGTHPTRSAVGP